MKNIGIWIDSREAIIMELENGKIRKEIIPSGVERKVRFPGETSHRSQRNFSGFDFESEQQSHYNEEIKKYLKIVAHQVHGARGVYIIGPGETKSMLEKRITDEGKTRVLKIEACGDVTENQKIEKVRKFFEVN